MMERFSRALVIAPHPDDEVLGAGGTMAALHAHGCEVHVLVASQDQPPLYPSGTAEMIRAEAQDAHARLGVTSTEYLPHPSVELARMGVAALNSGIQATVDRLHPDLVLAPFPDRHLDHKAVFEAAMVAVRPVGAGTGISAVALYETISETHWNAPHIEADFTPDWFVDISDHIDAKLTAFAAYASQVQDHPGPRSLAALKALAVFRGSQASLAFAETFHTVRRITRSGDWASE
ncbi:MULTISPECIES: PIG-L deacetylase family protein [unclassified Brevibacterium]|uniref:PIG-L deacetylase family protein n=1 Tax=Brevibacterium TaxID=1696 RepID=UPI002647C2B8|nr:PIG-L deacetylase family protein [Brevibacterium sp.]MDN5585104.1 PIG-L family deacetylase [Brevibacterium sp.]MDN5833481.1 PIG-L family deacetylase [Brevibacterium sp.]MDN5908843.1 PIG-L family deacetylase [Brevibacterium sp.]MDN6158505.1 PIG-L family deacetylase [Brevibacterium sp.]MDN6604038.1 PIG-L family deacetylase [Brevibacterium sp.]